MGAIDYERFHKMLLRSEEVAREPGMKPRVLHVYNDTLKLVADTFRTAHKAARQAEESFRKQHKEAFSAIRLLPRGYREARIVVRAFVRHTQLPVTLAALTTDLDRLDAIEKLLDTVDSHAGHPWADELLRGEFGQRAGRCIKEINELMAEDMTLCAVRDARAKAFGPAYERYLRFKRVVRDVLGSMSTQYQWVHLGSIARNDDDVPPATVPDPVVVHLPLPAALLEQQDAGFDHWTDLLFSDIEH